MGTTIRRNERSWAIDLIGKINEFAGRNDFMIKKAGGETTISSERGDTMFPDVLLYGDKEQTVILQGWEIKMPDVPIEDETFIRDAQRKADALKVDSCLIWNFTYAVLYARRGRGAFRKVKQWNETSHIRTRKDVETFRADWERLLEKIVVLISGYFATGRFRHSSLRDVIPEASIAGIIRRDKDIVAEKLRDAAFRDAVAAAHIGSWWLGVRAEYEHDEEDAYKAYAKTVILNWANRIVFAHIIKKRRSGAFLVDRIGYGTSPKEANAIFAEISAACDFLNVFSAVEYNDILPDAAWRDFVELSCFLRNNGIERLSHETLQNILEGSVAGGRREINGQYTTPPRLARLLVRLGVRDLSAPVLDCCCGTGTIPRAAIQLKKEHFTPREAVESVWACDKYSYPLQIANLSMTGADTICLPNRLFRHNALTLTPGEAVAIVDPGTGREMEIPLPVFSAVVSNLPFVPFEIIPKEDKEAIAKMPPDKQMDGRADLYCHIAVKIADVLRPGGTLGIITSNSWLGTKAGAKFLSALEKTYEIKQVHISGKGRWFKNADVVATLMILEKKTGGEPGGTDFWLWKRSLEELAKKPDCENCLVNSALLSKELDGKTARLSTYSRERIRELSRFHVSYNALFHDIGWLPGLGDKIVPIREVFRVFRGSRRGWDALFYPEDGAHHIEDVYLKKVLVNARRVRRLIAAADRNAFCCGRSVRELRANGHSGALAWIEKFRDQKNGVGKPLPAVLKRAGMQWYELQDREVAEFFTMMNPDRRIFFARFQEPSFVNQRLIGLTHRAGYPDAELNHALLNSMFTMFSIEASGFGRGLGALDINKDGLSKCCLFNPALVAPESRGRIVAAFEKVKAREIMGVSDELRDPARLAFEQEVLRGFGIAPYFAKIRSSLLSLCQTRAAARIG